MAAKVIAVPDVVLGNDRTNNRFTLTSILQRRRQSFNPRPPTFMVSAPGKIIIFGEHSVVYGKVRLPDPRRKHSFLRFENYCIIISKIYKEG